MCLMDRKDHSVLEFQYYDQAYTRGEEMSVEVDGHTCTCLDGDSGGWEKMNT